VKNRNVKLSKMRLLALCVRINTTARCIVILYGELPQPAMLIRGNPSNPALELLLLYNSDVADSDCFYIDNKTLLIYRLCPVTNARVYSISQYTKFFKKHIAGDVIDILYKFGRG